MSLPEFQARQREFLRTIRNQSETALTFIEDDRRILYQQLIFNSNDTVLKTSFPILREIISKREWEQLVKGYLKDYLNPTQVFHEIPRYFVEYLRQFDALPEALIQLAHYEWLELAVELMEVTPQFESVGGIEASLAYEINPTAVLMEYDYPVHEIGPGHYPLALCKTYVVVYRDRDDSVQFMVLDLLAARLLHLLEVSQGCALDDVLKRICAELSLDDMQSLGDAPVRLLSEWAQIGVVTRVLE